MVRRHTSPDHWRIAGIAFWSASCCHAILGQHREMWQTVTLRPRPISSARGLPRWFAIGCHYFVWVRALVSATLLLIRWCHRAGGIEEIAQIAFGRQPPG